ncbi:MAG: T9SS type A sorting domain-containing protein [Bacteroidia bacterium]
MKIIKLIFLVPFILVSKINAQPFCFWDPNTGGFYSNGSSGAIYDATSGDFNSDGFIDIVTANSVGGNISFIPGYGNGTLGVPDTTTVPATLFCITSGDFNGDGNLDVATANHGNVFVLFGNGNGTFQPYVSYAAGSSPSRIYCKDISNDGVPDLIEAASGGVFVLIGQSSGTFFPSILYPTGGDVNDITIVDFDSDAILDIVSTTHIDAINSELSFLKGNSSGIFASTVSVFSMTYPYNFIAGITAGDVNNDGKEDLIVANSGNSSNRIELYFGIGNGTFSSPIFYPTLGNPFYVYLTDFDNDLIKDIVVEEGNGYTVLKGNSNGTYNTPQFFLAMSTPNTLVIADFNGDGKMDLIIPSAYSGSPLIAVNLNCTITGIDDILQSANTSINIFPNPFSSSTNLQSDQFFNNATLTVYNSIGQQVKQIKNISGQTVIFKRDNLPVGLYYIRLTLDNKVFFTDKLIITD